MKRLPTPYKRTQTALFVLILTAQTLLGLSNSDVITLHKAGIGADTIALAVNNAEEKNFDTSTNGLVELKEAGVDDAVIQAILLTAGPSKLNQPAEQGPVQATVDVEAVAVPTVKETPVEKVEPSAPIPQVNTGLVEYPTPSPMPEVSVAKPQKRPPQPIYRPAPVYPPALKEKGTTGSVRVQFTVSTDGDVQNITVLESDHDLFSAAAIEALAAWEFNPGTVDGKPADSDVKLEIPFNIKAPVSSINRPPKALYKPTPNYPKALRQQGVTGSVKVQVVVNAAGEVQDINVVSSDHEQFTEEAVKVLDRWKFAPALKEGQPIDSRVQFSIPFKITE